MEYTALGLPLIGLPEQEGYTVSPLSALVVIKAIDSDGDEVYAVLMTPDMSPMEGTGLARFATLFCENGLQESIHASARQSQTQ